MKVDTTLASKFETKFNRLLRETEVSIKKAQDEVSRTHATGGNLPLKTITLIGTLFTTVDTLRDLCIYRSFLKGVPQKDIAALWGLSRSRISQIVTMVKAQNQHQKQEAT